MIYNPLNKFYKSKIGAIKSDEILKFRVKDYFGSVLLVLKKDNEQEEFYKMEKIGGFYEVDIKLETGLYFYCFQISDGRYIGKGKDYTGQVFDEIRWFQLTVFDKDYFVPNSICGGIIYQIFPDRFYSSNKNKKIGEGKVLHQNWLDTPEFMPDKNGEILNNDFFGGDIKGIEQKLEYLKSLSVSTIYLNPIFKAYSNHRYDTGDYMQVDELLGDENDLISLIESAKKFGINVVLDGVFNHTGSDSIYFNSKGNYDSLGAFQSKNSPYYTWYDFIDYPNKYHSWWGIKTLPAVNKNNSDFLEFIAGENGVIEYYTKLGIGGWRLDVVDELPAEFVRKIRRAVKKINQNAIIIGEVWEDASNKIAYGVRREYFQGKELDSVMNYPLKDAIINFIKEKNCNNLVFTLKEQIDHYPKGVLDSLMNIISTHDTKRLLTVVGGEEDYGKTKSQLANKFISKENLGNAKFLLKVASLIQYTVYGVPSLYYGDEAGMQGYQDPFNRRCYPWGQEDNELLDWYKKLGQIRSSYSAFVNGDLEIVYAKGGVLLYKRTNDDCELLIAVNISDYCIDFSFEGELVELFSQTNFNNYCTLKAKSLGIFLTKP